MTAALPLPAPVRDPITHDLKCWPVYFAEVVADRKPFELRKNDRDYREGDTLNLHEWDPATKQYSGECETRIVTYVLANTEHLAPGYVAIGMRRP